MAPAKSPNTACSCIDEVSLIPLWFSHFTAALVSECLAIASGSRVHCHKTPKLYSARFLEFDNYLIDPRFTSAELDLVGLWRCLHC